MSMRHRRVQLLWCALLLAIPPASACVNARYQCEADAQCMLEDSGRCEATGYCSYVDDGCVSGRRYSDLAGPVASRCVDASEGTSAITGSTVGGASGSGGAPGSGGVSGSDGVSESGDVSICGDGVVQPPEECDDPDGTQGEGCDRACRTAGIVDFLVTYDASGGNDKFFSVAAFPGGGVAVAGYDRPDAGSRDALVVRYDAAGDEVWLARHDLAGQADEAHAVGVSGDGTVYVAGHNEDETRNFTVFRASWEGDGDLRNVFPLDDKDAWGIDETAQGTWVVVGGNFADRDGWAARVPRSTTAPDWTLDVVSPRGQGSMLTGVSAWTEAESFVTGYIDNRLVLGRVDETGFELLAELPSTNADPFDRGQAIARSAETSWLYVAGYVTLDADEGRAGWLGAFDLAGTLQWQVMLQTVFGLTEYEAVVVDSVGNVYVGGFDGGAGQQGFIRAYDPDGTFLWDRHFPDLDEAIVRDLALDDDGQLWVVGETESPNGDLDGFLARVAV